MSEITSRVSNLSSSLLMSSTTAKATQRVGLKTGTAFSFKGKIAFVFLHYPRPNTGGKSFKKTFRVIHFFTEQAMKLNF